MATDAYILKESALLSMRALKSLFTLIQEVMMILVLPFRGRRKVSHHQMEKDEKRHDCHRKGTVVRVPAKMVPWKNSISISSNGGGGAMKVVDQVVMVRREMAVRRVMEEDNDESCVREYWLFGTRRGDTIFTQSWTPVSVQIRGIILLMHGLNEHSGRYSDFAKQLNANGFKVYGMDWVGISYLDAIK
ncbi:putative triacylglycerol lipase [Lupinus albus]|uniref:Putative triacylglycerol lipase n=1 Tax=Lupinus albus TaxID=3870 RepID=A0A6A4N3N9_LUPAL|nr:putative triacylglycerol lipase [Lupinus albus]